MKEHSPSIWSCNRARVQAVDVDVFAIDVSSFGALREKEERLGIIAVIEDDNGVGCRHFGVSGEDLDCNWMFGLTQLYGRELETVVGLEVAEDPEYWLWNVRVTGTDAHQDHIYIY